MNIDTQTTAELKHIAELIKEIDNMSAHVNQLILADIAEEEAHNHATLKEQGDRSTCRRGQVGRQPALSREADKTQYARGSACSIRAIAAARCSKQTG